MMWDPDPADPADPAEVTERRMTMSQERLLEWTKETLEVTAKVQDPTKPVESQCPKCGEAIFTTIGRHSKKPLTRHAKAGCMPQGGWV